jgi:hypothetical protein
LAESYKALNQPLAAQPIVEELTSMKGDDIEIRGVHELAGAVQSGSGQRVVETKLLREEATRRDNAEYWIERADYYSGRNEDQLQLQAYREGLLAVPNHPRDAQAATQRLELVRRFAFFLVRDSDNEEVRHAELVKSLNREFTSAPPETDYAFRIAELLTQNELEVDELRISLLTSKPALFARLLATRKEWETSEESLIEDVTTGDEVTTEQKKRIWAELERLIDHPGSIGKGIPGVELQVVNSEGSLAGGDHDAVALAAVCAYLDVGQPVRDGDRRHARRGHLLAARPELEAHRLDAGPTGLRGEVVPGDRLLEALRKEDA